MSNTSPLTVSFAVSKLRSASSLRRLHGDGALLGELLLLDRLRLALLGELALLLRGLRLRDRELPLPIGGACQPEAYERDQKRRGDADALPASLRSPAGEEKLQNLLGG